MRSKLVPPTSRTHDHLLAVLNTELRHNRLPATIRVLDAGCGDGKLMSYLHLSMALLQPEYSVEIHGFDVTDYRGRECPVENSCVDRLESECPGINWRERVRLISVRDSWPFDDGFFDFVVSNQVLEHVFDADHFLAELRRTLCQRGRSFHLFPLRSCVYEGHLGMPFAHWIQNFDVSVLYLKALASLGLGEFRTYGREAGVTLQNWAEAHADFLSNCVHYRSYQWWLDRAKRHGLRCSFRYSSELYLQKLRSLCRIAASLEYAYDRFVLGEWMALQVTRWLASITLCLENTDSYANSLFVRGPAHVGSSCSMSS